MMNTSIFIKYDPYYNYKAWYYVNEIVFQTLANILFGEKYNNIID